TLTASQAATPGCHMAIGRLRARGGEVWQCGRLESKYLTSLSSVHPATVGSLVHPATGSLVHPATSSTLPTYPPARASEVGGVLVTRRHTTSAKTARRGRGNQNFGGPRLATSPGPKCCAGNVARGKVTLLRETA